MGDVEWPIILNYDPWLWPIIEAYDYGSMIMGNVRWSSEPWCMMQ